MGRPARMGLDYFNVDTEWENEMKLIKAKFGLMGIGCMVELWKMIYKHGYKIQWDEDIQILFCSENSIDQTKLNEIIQYACRKGLFDNGLLQKGYLTSHGIQKRWLLISNQSGRKTSKIEPEFDLMAVNSEETIVNSEETPINSEFMPQSKVKETKEKESKGNDDPLPAKTLNDYYIDYWNKLGFKRKITGLPTIFVQFFLADQKLLNPIWTKSRIKEMLDRAILSDWLKSNGNAIDVLNDYDRIMMGKHDNFESVKKDKQNGNNEPELGKSSRAGANPNKEYPTEWV